jgi:tetratricopeptide (TPR) repeat protein
MRSKNFDAATQIRPKKEAWYLNRKCHARAALDGDLKEALAECNKSLHLEADGRASASRALVFFKLNRLAEALSDYEAALKQYPKLASALYGRGIVKRRLGLSGGEVDIEAAKEVDPKIAETYARFGLTL